MKNPASLEERRARKRNVAKQVKRLIESVKQKMHGTNKLFRTRNVTLPSFFSPPPKAARLSGESFSVAKTPSKDSLRLQFPEVRDCFVSFLQLFPSAASPKHDKCAHRRLQFGAQGLAFVAHRVSPDSRALCGGGKVCACECGDEHSS
jgi:hypothetical protein